MAKQLAHVAVVLSMFAAVTAQARQDQAPPDPKFTAAMQKGEAALKARRFEEAIDAFKQANAIEKKTSAAAFYGLGRAYQGLGAFKSGAESCAEGLKHVGDDRRLQAMLLNQRGMALFSLADKNTDKEIRDAETEFRSALSSGRSAADRLVQPRHRAAQAEPRPGRHRRPAGLCRQRRARAGDRSGEEDDRKPAPRP